MKEALDFQCDLCGLCCQLLEGKEDYQDLDDGTGVCCYFDQQTKLCQIYQTRPEKCNVTASYKHYKDRMSLEEYLILNQEGCQKIKEEFRCHYHF